MKNFKTYTIIALLASISLLFISCQQEELKENVSVEEFHDKWQDKDITLLDVRTVEEYRSGHIKGSVLMPVNDGKFKESIQDLPKDKPVVVYCRSGVRAATAAGILKENGFTKVHLLDGSINAWNQSGYPLEK